VALLLVAGAFLLGRHSQALVVATAPTLVGAQPALTMPALRESFTLLPCSPTTTIGLEGCAEHRILTLDSHKRVLRRQLLQDLYDNAAKRRFIVGEVDWFVYRHATCSSEADVNEGGSLAPVDFADCLVNLDEQHLSELTALKSSYENR
jgi:uncharacterized protein YecT (DUF1311 family)